MKPIIFEIIDNVAYIKLNRPEVYNSFNQEMAEHLRDLLDQCKEDLNVRALWISGEGKAFCAGLDLKEATNFDGDAIRNLLGNHYIPIIKQIRNLPKPVVAAVNGVAAGAGANLALACDIVLASQEASFIQSFSKVGLIPDCSGTFILPRLVGWARASALMMMGDRVTASEAYHMGMIYKVFQSEIFDLESKNLVKHLAYMPTKALAFTKFALNESFLNSLEDQLSVELKYQILAGETQDFREGIAAFLQKRVPIFRGI